jgi:hypothetical protein
LDADAGCWHLVHSDVFNDQREVTNRCAFGGGWGLGDGHTLRVCACWTGIELENAARSVEDGRASARHGSLVTGALFGLAGVVDHDKGSGSCLADLSEQVQVRPHLRRVLVGARRGSSQRINDHQVRVVADPPELQFGIGGVEVHARHGRKSNAAPVEVRRLKAVTNAQPLIAAPGVARALLVVEVNDTQRTTNVEVIPNRFTCRSTESERLKGKSFAGGAIF